MLRTCRGSTYAATSFSAGQARKSEHRTDGPQRLVGFRGASGPFACCERFHRESGGVGLERGGEPSIDRKLSVKQVHVAGARSGTFFGSPQGRHYSDRNLSLPYHSRGVDLVFASGENARTLPVGPPTTGRGQFPGPRYRSSSRACRVACMSVAPVPSAANRSSVAPRSRR